MRLIIVDILTTTIDRRKRIAFIAWIRSIFKTANFPLGLMQFICCLSIHMFCSMCRWTLPFTRNLPEQLCAIFEAMPPQYRAQNLICSSYHDIINACDANEIEIRSTALFDCAAWSGKAVVRFQSSYIYFFFIAFISHTHTQQYIFLAIISVIRGMKIGWVILSDRLTMCNIANRIGPRVFAKCAAISVVHAYAYEFSTQPQIHSRGSLNNTLIIIIIKSNIQAVHTAIQHEMILVLYITANCVSAYIIYDVHTEMTEMCSYLSNTVWQPFNHFNVY